MRQEQKKKKKIVKKITRNIIPNQLRTTWKYISIEYISLYYRHTSVYAFSSKYKRHTHTHKPRDIRTRAYIQKCNLNIYTKYTQIEWIECDTKCFPFQRIRSISVILHYLYYNNNNHEIRRCICGITHDANLCESRNEQMKKKKKN